MPKTAPFTLELPCGELQGIVTLPERPGARPAVIVSHGFKGFLDWGFFPSLAELLAERGFTVIRFNYRGSGMRPGDDLVTDLDAFRRATIGQDLEDLRGVVEAAGDGVAPGRVDRERIGLFGHSRGGGVSLLAASQDGLAGRIGALVTWAAVGTFDRLTAREKEAWRRERMVTVVNSRTGQELPVGIEVLEDLEANRERYDLEAAATRLGAPWLIVHGGRDERVPVGESELLERGARSPSRRLLIPDGDHTFGARHPFAGPTPHLIQALNATQAWFREHLA